jgi:hypothetical protein
MIDIQQLLDVVDITDDECRREQYFDGGVIIYFLGDFINPQDVIFIFF